MTTAYTIGAIRSYEEALAGGPVRKLGRSSEYEGGWVWQELDDAKAVALRTDLGFVAGVYELELPGEWSTTTFPGGDGVHHISEDSVIVRRVWPSLQSVEEFAEVWMGQRDDLAMKKMHHALEEQDSRRLDAINYVLDLLDQASTPLPPGVAALLSHYKAD
jgi:hypothetical protein